MPRSCAPTAASPDRALFIGVIATRTRADAAHTVYASMRDTGGRDAARIAAAPYCTSTHGVDLRSVELDVQSQDSADAAIDRVVNENGRLDALIHNAGLACGGAAVPHSQSMLATQQLARPCAPIVSRPMNPIVTWRSSLEKPR